MKHSDLSPFDPDRHFCIVCDGDNEVEMTFMGMVCADCRRVCPVCDDWMMNEDHSECLEEQVGQ